MFQLAFYNFDPNYFTAGPSFVKFFQIALFFTVSESRTFPIFISAQVSQAQIIWGNVAAATVIQSIPPILLTIFLQKNIVSGLTLGAVKN